MRQRLDYCWTGRDRRENEFWNMDYSANVISVICGDKNKEGDRVSVVGMYFKLCDYCNIYKTKSSCFVNGFFF